MHPVVVAVVAVVAVVVAVVAVIVFVGGSRCHRGLSQRFSGLILKVVRVPTETATRYFSCFLFPFFLLAILDCI
jgi:hypothetical protein